jgi:hypothetical protein
MAAPFGSVSAAKRLKPSVSQMRYLIIVHSLIDESGNALPAITVNYRVIGLTAVLKQLPCLVIYRCGRSAPG